MAKLVGLRA